MAVSKANWLSSTTQTTIILAINNTTFSATFWLASLKHSAEVAGKITNDKFKTEIDESELQLRVSRDIGENVELKVAPSRFVICRTASDFFRHFRILTGTGIEDNGARNSEIRA